MTLDENALLEIIAVRAFETADRRHTLWTDADRAWASRAAAVVAGEGAAPQAFLAQRAELALERIGERSKALRRATRSLRWRPWLATVLVVAAFASGLLIDRIGGTWINLLTPPVLTLLAWNLAVYASLAVASLPRKGDAAPAGPLRRALIRLAGGGVQPLAGGESGAAVLRFASDWSRFAGPLYAARAARILHLAAAMLAMGLLAGLYLRGMAVEYRASWQSTFLTASEVQRVLAIALAPGAAITGIALPTVEQVAAMRAPAGENAAQWLHLMAATVALVVIVPRLLLTLCAWVRERRISTHLPMALDEPYFQRLLDDFQGRSAQVQVLPYSYTPLPAAMAGLTRLVEGVFGRGTRLSVGTVVSYGGEDAFLAAGGPDCTGNVIVLFNATATPEPAAQGDFLAALAAGVGKAATLVALVDESALLARWGSASTRIEARRSAWRELCAGQAVPCAFADLAASELAAGEAALEHAFEGANR